METIATYWEKQIKIYGISCQEDLTLVRISCPGTQIQQWMSCIRDLHRFEIITYQPSTDRRYLLNLVTTSTTLEKAGAKLQQAAAGMVDSTVSSLTPVAAVFFHGPHFQERFGIADSLEQTLSSLNVTVHLFSCSGTSVHVIIPETDKDRVVTAVKNVFLIPGT